MDNNINKFNAFESEKTVLGTIITDPDVLLEIESILKPKDFYSEKHGLIYSLCWESYKKDGTVSLPYICEIAKDRVTAYELTVITEFAISKQSVIRLAMVVKEKSMFRQTQRMALNITDNLKKSDDLPEIISTIQLDLIDIIKKTRDEKNSKAVDIIPRLEETIRKNQKRGGIGLYTGMGFLSRAIRAYVPGHFWTIGAWTGSAKTSFMWELIKRIFEFNSTENPNVLVVSTEMTDEGNLLKLIGNYCGIPPLAILDYANRNPESQKAIGQAMIKAAEHNLSVVDNLYEWDDIYLKCKKEKLVNGLDIVFIDFLQNMSAPGTIYERMSTLAPRLQGMAKELECTVIALSQLANADAAGSDQLKYKGAGEIAAACDLGIILERGKDGDGCLTREIDVKIKKNRWGLTGKHLCQFNESYTSIDVVEQDKDENMGWKS